MVRNSFHILVDSFLGILGLSSHELLSIVCFSFCFLFFGFFRLYSLSGCDIKVILASLNELESVSSSFVFWKRL